MKIKRFLIILTAAVMVCFAGMTAFAETAGRDTTSAQASQQQVFDGISAVTKPSSSTEVSGVGIVLWAIILLTLTFAFVFLVFNTIRFQREKRLQLVRAKPKLIITQAGIGSTAKASRIKNLK